MRATQIIADPAWQYNARGLTRNGSRFGLGASGRYLTEATEEMTNIPVASLAADRCQLYMWVTWPFLPDGLRLMDAWGFSYSTCAFIWIKTNRGRWRWPIRKLAAKLLELNSIERFMSWLVFFGPGYYTAANSEFVLLGTKGQPFKPVKKPSQVIVCPGWYGEEHSRKPDDVHEQIMQMYPLADGHVYVELFARREYKHWHCLGNEIDGLDLRESIPLFVATPPGKLKEA